MTVQEYYETQQIDMGLGKDANDGLKDLMIAFAEAWHIKATLQDQETNAKHQDIIINALTPKE